MVSATSGSPWASGRNRREAFRSATRNRNAGAPRRHRRSAHALLIVQAERSPDRWRGQGRVRAAPAIGDTMIELLEDAFESRRRDSPAA